MIFIILFKFLPIKKKISLFSFGFDYISFHIFIINSRISSVTIMFYVFDLSNSSGLFYHQSQKMENIYLLVSTELC